MIFYYDQLTLGRTHFLRTKKRAGILKNYIEVEYLSTEKES